MYSTFGSLTAFLSPLASSLALDFTSGGATMLSWIACFATLGAGVALGPLALWLLKGSGRSGSTTPGARPPG